MDNSEYRDSIIRKAERAISVIPIEVRGLISKMRALNDGRQHDQEAITKPPPHTTMLHDMANWVIATYWQGKDPKTAPTKTAMIKILMQQKGLTRNEAEAVDLTTRHDSKRSRKNPPPSE